jgi:hypothetical protein
MTGAGGSGRRKQLEPAVEVVVRPPRSATRAAPTAPARLPRERKAREPGPSKPKRPPPRKLVPQRFTGSKGKKVSTRGSRAALAAFCLPGVYGDVRLPVGSQSIESAVTKMSETYQALNAQPSVPTGNDYAFLPYTDMLLVLRRAPLGPMILYDPNVTTSQISSSGYDVWLAVPTSNAEQTAYIDGDLTAQTGWVVFQSNFADGEMTPVPIAYCVPSAGATYNPFGLLMPVFVDKLENATRAAIYLQPGYKIAASFQLDTSWGMPGYQVLVQARLSRLEGGIITPIGTGATTLTTEDSTVLDLGVAECGYYCLDVSFSTLAGGGNSLGCSFSIVPDTSDYGEGIGVFHHIMSPSLAGAIGSQISDVRATGVAVVGSPTGQNLVRNGVVAGRNFSSDSWTQLIASQPSVTPSLSSGFAKLTSYNDYIQFDLTRGFAAWVRPGNLTTGFQQALSIDNNEILLTARSPLRDVDWLAISWQVDPTVAMSLSVAVSFGAEMLVTDKTRDTAVSEYDDYGTEEALMYLRRLPLPTQFTENPSHIAAALANIFGVPLKQIAQAAGPGVVSTIANTVADGAARFAPLVDTGLNLFEMLGNLF